VTGRQGERETDEWKKGTLGEEQVGGAAGILWRICDMSRDIEKFDCPPV